MCYNLLPFDWRSHNLRYTLFILFLVILCFVTITQSNAQKSNWRYATTADIVRDSSNRRIPSKTCNVYQSYIPDSLHPEFTPMREVRVNIHVMLDSKGQNNFPDNAQGRQWIKDMVRMASERLEKNQKMNLPKGNNTPVVHIPFRYVLTGRPGNPKDDGIYFHRDDTLSFMNKKAKGNNNSVYDSRPFNVYGIQKDTVINVFIMEHFPDSIKSKTYRSTNDGIGVGAWAKIVGSYNLWKNPQITPKGDTIRFSPWDAAALFNHELGHCLGLQHTWNMDDGCDDTPKNPGCWNYNEPPGCQEVSNNVMDYNAYKMAYTPCQIGRINKNFYDDKVTRKYLKPDWCTFTESKSDTIRNGEKIEWDGSVDVLGNLVIENNATLTIYCTASIPPGGKIILYPKATLILDGCILTSRCSQPFDGIAIMSKKKTSPKIYFKNGAIIQNVTHPIQ